MGKLPDRSINPPFSASSFSRHRGAGGGGGGGGLAATTTTGGDFGAEKPPVSVPGPAHSQSHSQSQDATAASNPLSRLTEDQREEINEAVGTLPLPLQ